MNVHAPLDTASDKVKTFDVFTNRPTTLGEYIDMYKLFLQISSMLKKNIHALNFSFTNWTTIFSEKTRIEKNMYYDSLNKFMLKNHHTIPPWLIHSLYSIIDPLDMLNMYGAGPGDLNRRLSDINIDNKIITLQEWTSWLLDCPDEYQEIIMHLFDANDQWDIQFLNGYKWTDIPLDNNLLEERKRLLAMFEFINEITLYFKNSSSANLMETQNLCSRIQFLMNNHTPCTFGYFYFLQSIEENKKNLFHRSILNFLQKNVRHGKISLPVRAIHILTGITGYNLSEEQWIKWLINDCNFIGGCSNKCASSSYQDNISICIDNCHCSALWRNLLKVLFFVDENIDIDIDIDINYSENLRITQELIEIQHRTIESYRQIVHNALNLINKKNYTISQLVNEASQLRLINDDLRYYLDDTTKEIQSLLSYQPFYPQTYYPHQFDHHIYNVHKKQSKSQRKNLTKKVHKMNQKVKDANSKNKHQENKIEKLNQKLKDTTIVINNLDDENNNLIAAANYYKDEYHKKKCERDEMNAKITTLDAINKELFDKIKTMEQKQEYIVLDSHYIDDKQKQEYLVLDSHYIDDKQEREYLKKYLKDNEYFRDIDNNKIMPLWIMYAISNITGCLFKNEDECFAWLENCDESYCSIINMIIESKNPNILYAYCSDVNKNNIDMFCTKKNEETGYIGYGFEDDETLTLYFTSKKLICAFPLIETCEVCNSFVSANGKKLKSCGHCRKTKYCSVECQSADWDIHEALNH